MTHEEACNQLHAVAEMLAKGKIDKDAWCSYVGQIIDERILYALRATPGVRSETPAPATSTRTSTLPDTRPPKDDRILKKAIARGVVRGGS